MNNHSIQVVKKCTSNLLLFLKLFIDVFFDENVNSWMSSTS